MKKHLNLVSIIVFASYVLSACGPGQLFGPTITPTPTPTLTPTITPTSTPTLTPTPTNTPTEMPRTFTVLKSTIEGNLLGVVVVDDGGFSLFGPVWIGVSFLNDESYVIDETGVRLDFVKGESNDANQVVLVFSGASSNHHYQLIQPNKPPIDLFPE